MRHDNKKYRKQNAFKSVFSIADVDWYGKGKFLCRFLIPGRRRIDIAGASENMGNRY